MVLASTMEVTGMIHVQVDDAKTQLNELFDAAMRGETVLIEKAGEQGIVVVQLIVVSPRKQERQFGSARGLIETADDFDAPLDDFREYME